MYAWRSVRLYQCMLIDTCFSQRHSDCESTSQTVAESFNVTFATENFAQNAMTSAHDARCGFTDFAIDQQYVAWAAL